MHLYNSWFKLFKETFIGFLPIYINKEPLLALASRKATEQKNEYVRGMVFGQNASLHKGGKKFECISPQCYVPMLST